MVSLIALGHLTDLAEAAGAFEACVAARKFYDPEPLRIWAERIRVDEPGGKALILPAGTVVPDDFELDYDNAEVEAHRIGSIIALGDLTIQGRLINLNSDGGPFLLIGGTLKAEEILKAGAAVVVLGHIETSGTIFCDYCHGTMQICGDVTAPLVILNDHELAVSGTVHGRVLSSETCELRDVLVPEVFFDPDDDDDEWPEGGLIAERLLAGLPVLRDGA